MKFVYLIAAATLGLTAQANAADIAMVRIHADWCPACQALEPKLDGVNADLARDDLPVREVLLDYTARNKADFWAQADQAGIKAPLDDYLDGKIKTGLFILIDEDRDIVVAKANSSFSEEEIYGAVRAAALQ